MTDLADLTSKTFGQAKWSLVMDMMQLELQKKKFGGLDFKNFWTGSMVVGRVHDAT